MECPACGSTLSPFQVGDATIDACRSGCGGIWFDEKELQRVDEKQEFSDHEILKLAKEKEKNKVDHKKIKPCPRCKGEVLVRQFFDPKNEIEIDQCWNCCGIWLDVGELNAVRTQYETAADRKVAVEAYVSAHIADVSQKLSKLTKQQLVTYEHQTRNRLAAGLFAFRRLLGA